MKKYTWQKLRMIGWSLLSISLILRIIFSTIISTRSIGVIPYSISLLGIILVALGYWYGEVKS